MTAWLGSSPVSAWWSRTPAGPASPSPPPQTRCRPHGCCWSRCCPTSPRAWAGPPGAPQRRSRQTGQPPTGSVRHDTCGGGTRKTPNNGTLVSYTTDEITHGLSLEQAHSQGNRRDLLPFPRMQHFALLATEVGGGTTCQEVPSTQVTQHGNATQRNPRRLLPRAAPTLRLRTRVHHAHGHEGTLMCMCTCIART